MKKKSDNKSYVVVATAFGHKDQQISSPMGKERADGLAASLTDDMDKVDGDFKVFENIKVKEYTPIDLYVDKQKNDPYDYNVLDALDKKISGGKDFKVDDESGKVEK